MPSLAINIFADVVACRISTYRRTHRNRVKKDWPQLPAVNDPWKSALVSDEVAAEQCPTFFGGDPDTFAAGLAYEHRPINTELEMLAVVRRQMATILHELKAEDFQRTGNHSEAGSLSLETLLLRISDHVPHHIRFINEKRKALGFS